MPVDRSSLSRLTAKVTTGDTVVLGIAFDYGEFETSFIKMVHSGDQEGSLLRSGSSFDVALFEDALMHFLFHHLPPLFQVGK